MPTIIQGNFDAQTTHDLQKIDHGYEYPDGLDLKPGSDFHDELVTKLMQRVQHSAEVMGSRFESWNTQDQFLTAYTWADEEEQAAQEKDSRKPRSIVFPYSYAILETLLAYMMGVFFQDPVFRYEGYGSDDVVGAILTEKVIQMQVTKFSVMLNLHTMFRDSFTYGIGPVAPIWKSIPNSKFEGNALENIDPYKYLPDPNVAVNNIQEGEYIAWVNDTNYVNMLSEEETNEDLFNVKYIKELNKTATSIYGEENSGRYQKSGYQKPRESLTGPVDEIPIYIKLIPKEWGLGDKEYPEIWYFKIAGDRLILSARPADFDHGLFPVVASAPDFDGYSPTPLGRMEILGGLQHVLDFLFNSHIANVRKAINDMLVVDPYRVNIKDLQDPSPGKLIRLRRGSWGTGIKDAVQQLQVNDITRANVGDSSWIVQWMQTIGATDNPAMGSLRQGGPDRLTKAEFQGTMSGGASRLERVARVISLQAMLPIGRFFAAHNKQMLDDDVYIKVAGEHEALLREEYAAAISRGRMSVSPYDLDVTTDVIVRDGTMPGSNYSPVWEKMFSNIAEHPELANEFDIVKIFKHIARNNGAKDPNEFVKAANETQTTTMPDEEVAEQIQAGNLVPLGGAQ